MKMPPSPRPTRRTFVALFAAAAAAVLVKAPRRDRKPAAQTATTGTPRPRWIGHV